MELAWLTCLALAVAAPPSAPAWHGLELSFQSQVERAALPVDIRLAVTFTAADGRGETVPGFWDGGRTWRCRVACLAPGAYRWRSACTDAGDTGLHAQSGEVTVTPAAEDHALYSHGFLRVSANGRYLVLADGTPFLWLGDTAWAAPMKATLADWQSYCTNRAQAGFTVTQVSPASDWAGATDAEGRAPFAGDDLSRPNPAFWAGYDAKIRAANDAGLVVLVVGLMEPRRRYPDAAQACRLAQWLAARLQDRFVVFSPSFDSPPLPLANQVGSALREVDHRHLLTQHPGTAPAGPTATWSEFYAAEPYLDFIGVQSGHNGGDLVRAYRQAAEWPLALWRRTPARPVINLEAMYDAGSGPLRGGDAAAWRTADARALGWLSLLSGCAGYTYGAGETNHKVPGGHGGLYAWCTEPAAYDFWRKVIDWPGTAQMGHLAAFLRRVEWWRLQPDPARVLDQPADLLRRRPLARSDRGDLLCLYLPDGDRVALDLHDLAGPWQAVWCDPLGGHETVDAQPVLPGAQVVLRPPHAGEWALRLVASGRR